MYDVMKEAAKIIGGGDTAEIEIAQAGGENVEMFDQALTQCTEAILSKLKRIGFDDTC